MLVRVLKQNRLLAGVALACAGIALVLAGCFGRLRLRDLRHLSRGGPSQLLTMGGCDALQDPNVECVTCHTGARTREKAGMPDRALCLSCHGGLPDAALFELGADYFDEKGRPKWEAVARLSEDIVFSHLAHDRFECEECHGDVKRGDFTLMDVATHYANCRRCHRNEEITGDCLGCHFTFKPSRRPHSHDARWLDDHGWAVRDAGGLGAADRACGSCHDRSFCVECHHETKPRDHNLFWTKASHGMAADIDRRRCYICHRQDECMSCHTDGAPPSCGRPLLPSGTCSGPGCHDPFMLPTSTRLMLGHRILTENCVLCHR